MSRQEGLKALLSRVDRRSIAQSKRVLALVRATPAQLQIVRALPLLEWKRSERKAVIQILRRNVEHPQKFVRVGALDSLATLAARDPGLVPVVKRGLEDFARSGSKALQTRAKHIRERLGV